MKNILCIGIIFCCSISLQAQSLYYDLSKMSKNELRITRNTVFAKHGREFKTKQMKEHFGSKIWYSINPQYSDQLLTDSDKDLISIIQIWENSPKIVDYKKIDLNKDGDTENCFLLKTNDSKKLYILIDNYYIEIDNLCEDWNGDLIPMDINQKFDIYNLRYSPINILGFKRSTCDYDCCGDTYHFVYFYNNKINIIDLEYFTSDKPLYVYNNSNIQRSFIVNEGGWCRTVKKDFYEFFNEKLTLTKTEENKISYTEAVDDNELWRKFGRNCAACFVSNSKVLTDKNQYMFIEDLNIGDTVLSYNFESKNLFTTTILEMAETDHSNLVNLYFSHDTITSTSDHPYFLYKKGWSSFDPNTTVRNYKNYDDVKMIHINDDFMSYDGDKVKLLSFSKINRLSKTFTITKLAEGNSFFVNGVLVGVEEIPINFVKYLKNK